MNLVKMPTITMDEISFDDTRYPGKLSYNNVLIEADNLIVGYKYDVVTIGDVVLYDVTPIEEKDGVYECTIDYFKIRHDEELPEQIMDLLREHSKDDSTYVNPHFLTELSNLLETYYKLEDDKVNSWIYDMFGM